MSTPLPREHPLWDMLLLTNVEGGGAALLVRLHHAIADGIALIRVLLQMVDVPPATPQIAPAARRASSGGFGSSLPGEARVPLNPGRILDLAAQAAGALTKLVSKRADPASPLKGNLGERKRAALTKPLPLERIKATGKALGATVNDVLITALSTAVARYLRARGRDLKRLRAVVPVDLRDPRAKFELGTKFGLVFLSLPLGDMTVPERLAVVKRRMDRIKKSPEAVVVFGILNSVGGLPAEFEKRLVELFGSKATAVVTNVPGPGEKLALAGCTVDSLMFWVPQSGRLGLGVSILSYGGSVRVGVAADAGLMPRPEELAEYFEEAVAELEATAMEPAQAT
jgi:WS/DGAT/MGAT family acyltransferase